MAGVAVCAIAVIGVMLARATVEPPPQVRPSAGVVLTVPAPSTPGPATTPVPTPAVTVEPIRPDLEHTPPDGDAVQGALRSVVKVRTDRGTGSGVVIAEHGEQAVVITNAHVVEGGATVSVIAPDGVEHPARVIGTEASLDLAVLTVDAGGAVVPASWGNPRALRPGDPLYVVGFPLGSELLGDPTVTRGIMSGWRMIDGVGYVQTDAAMNPGNSGGAVLNQEGEVVGIATLRIAGANGQPITGINFAVPSDLAREAAARILPDVEDPGGAGSGPYS